MSKFARILRYLRTLKFSDDVIYSIQRALFRYAKSLRRVFSNLCATVAPSKISIVTHRWIRLSFAPVASSVYQKIHTTVRRSKIGVRYAAIPRRHKRSISISLLGVVLIIVSILIPILQVQAAQTLTWSDNADFSFNKASQCQPTQLDNVSLSTDIYTDTTCSAATTDSSLKLNADMYSFGPVTSISGGTNFSLAVKEDGTVWSWGNNADGQLGDGTTITRTMPVQVLDTSSVGVLTGIVAVSAGLNFSLALGSDGTVWAWGNNSFGRLGDNTTTNRLIPVQVKGLGGSGFLSDVSSVRAGGSSSLALKNDGTVWSWGQNGNSQLGTGDYIPRSAPGQVKGLGGVGTLSGVTSISAGVAHNLALKDDGTVLAWGLNTDGRLGDGTILTRSTPVRVSGLGGVGTLSGVTSISAGYDFSLVLKEGGTIWAWGSNTDGQLGNGIQQTVSSTPTQVKNNTGSAYFSNATIVSAGNAHTMAVKDDGTVWAWGDNSKGQLGNNSLVVSILPVQVKDTSGLAFQSGVTSISAGDTHSLAIKDDGTVWAWGSNTLGQAGYTLYKGNVLTPRAIITAIDTGSMTDIKQVEAGSTHSLALKNDGTVWAWGDNTKGQLGTGNAELQLNPVQVKNASGDGFLTGITAISIGTNYSLALKSDGTVWSWGINSSGQLGMGGISGVLYALPIQVKETGGTGFLSNVTSINAGSVHSLALKSDGTVWSWGNNTDGKLGDGTITAQPTPVQVKSPSGIGFLTSMTSIDAGYTHSIAIKSDGTVWAWGNNVGGRLGDGTVIGRTLPVQMRDETGSGYITDATAISAGDAHSIVLKRDGTVWGCGINSNGQLGIGTATSQALPVQVQGLGGSGLLTGITAISAGTSYTIALKNDTTVWAWGTNYAGRLGDGTSIARTTPAQVKGQGGVGYLSDVVAVSAGDQHSLALTSSKTAWAWGYNVTRQLGYAPNDVAPSNSLLPVPVSYTNYKSGFATKGSLAGIVVDAGANKRSKWYGVSWKTDSLPTNTSVQFNARTSDDGVTWSNWNTAMTQSTTGTVAGTGTIEDLAYSRFLELKVTLQSSDHVATPKVTEFTLNYLKDMSAPTVNASDITMSKSKGTAVQAENSWANTPPYFAWSPGSDGTGESGIMGYCMYLGHDQSASVVQTKGLLGNSSVDSNGACPFVAALNELDLSSSGALGSEITSSNDTYYVLIKAIDNAGNVYPGAPAEFAFRYDNTPPTNPAFISAPAQFISTKNVTLTWPTNGGQEANDTTSGLAGLQYRIGTGGTWYGDAHTGAQDTTDVLANDGSYTFDPTFDYPLLHDGNNIVYFRTIDNAGNVSSSFNTAAIKISTSSPTPPQNLEAVPTVNTLNSFSFAWQPPQAYVGSASGLTYCYSVNTLPSDTTCSFTVQTSLPYDSYATQPNQNTLYVVAKDEAGNINYDTYASVTFTANTPAPGISGNFEISDISTKATRAWKLALSWSEPQDTGAGVARYAIYRSTNGTSFTQIATTSGLSYVDSSLSQLTYYYKIKACDSANNCGAFSQVVSQLPTGRFTTPPELVTSPSVEASTKTASFHWTTDRMSDSRIQYGTKSGSYFPGEITVGTMTKSHQVDLLSLEAGMTYYYKVKWTDEDGNIGSSGELTFTTAPAPTVKNILVINKTLDSATIQFTATYAAKVSIYYGKDNGFGGVKSVNTSRQESTYTLTLTGLSDGTLYSYKITTFDDGGNEYDSRRTDNFMTPSRPRITNLRFQPVVGAPTSTQKVTWVTNVPASTMVTYGKIGTLGSDIYSSALTIDHEILLHDLEDDSQYFLVAQSRDIDGNLAVGDKQVFKTSLDSRPPVIVEQRVESSVKGSGGEARGQIIVSWKTDEPASSQVSYANGGRGGSYANRTAEDTRLTTDHVVIISNLSTSAVYHIQPVSHDRAENAGHGSDQSVIIGRPTDNVLTIILNALNKIFGT